MKNYKIFIFLFPFVLLIVAAILIFALGSRPKMYGNDIASMETMIAQQLKTDETVTVFDTIDVEKCRYAGYIAGETQYAYAQFKANEHGDYELVEVKRASHLVRRAFDVSVSYSSLIKENETESTSYLVVVSSNPQLADIEWVIGGDIRRYPVDSNPSIHVFELPGQFSQYFFYDQSGSKMD
jgi:hypothetical protein